MNKTIIIPGLIAAGGITSLIISVSFGALTTAKPETPSIKQGFRSSVNQLSAQGQDQRCTLHQRSESADTKGVVYTSQDKSRSDLEIQKTDGAQTITAHLIKDGTWAYGWNSLTSQGTKVRIDPSDLAVELNSTDNPVNLQDQVSYQCQDWTVDASLFIPPRDISFRDVTGEVKNLQEDLRAKSQSN